MSSGARLTALRLVGFKSFAEKTTIEFGPGVSAVVGPNGSGKSNLADALRWTMGEQGRMLRTRRAEDVIFAGSSSRRAIGMADVTLVIDNSDRLLPVDFGEVEIGRRLYRSGESEYLLNRQRIRLRDLTELLDEGNLADNAFLFIGQGMVDQALALRPEERRPLFEEAAGVRRHERRRRQAEAELTEAEANLERLRDLLGELRPQAKRLAAQSEQLQARRTAGLELAEVLLAAARSRWLDVATAEGREARALDAARNASDKALAELHAAEQLATQTSAEMASHADEERARRAVLERERADVVEHRVKLARIESELSSLDEAIQRARSDREAIAVRLREAAVGSSVPQPTVDQAIATELEAVDRELAVLSAEGRGPDANAELTARRAEHDRHQRRSSELEQNLLAAQAELLRLGQRLTEAQTEHSATTAQLTEATAVVVAAEHSLESARTSQSAAAAEHTHVRGSRAELESEVVAARSRLSALESALEAMSDEGLARAARARGAKLVAEGVEIDARFRRAVAAVLDSAATAFVVDDPGPLAAPSRRGALV
ncbi:MAG TPA: AAA family ATPase, partial [Candidatus Limnocylindrales bacterium]|nr:AAA family ATPase [Candidatus Limnocylindrales bacterium]